MNKNHTSIVIIQMAICLFLAKPLYATVYPVSTKADLQTRMAAALPGDTIVVSDGSYNWDLISFTNTNGSATTAMIVLKAQTVSGVVFTGTTRLQFRGTGITVDGFKFANGNAATNAVIRLGTSSTNVSNDCRITNITFDNYNSDTEVENEWIGLYGVRNRIDHCTFINKANARATIVVWYTSATYPAPSLSTHHRIDSNYFSGRSYLGDNGGETIRVGTSTTSRTDGYNIIEYNLFENCTQTEPEIISNKSDFNTYRYNTFRNNKGGLTLRHGRYCDVYGNFFLVSNPAVTESYGIRVVDKGHRIFNNYIEAVNGNAGGGTTQLRAPINLYNGVSTDTTDPGTAALYFPADSCMVTFNTIVHARGGGGIILGGTGGGTIQPKGIVLANNLVKMSTGTALYRNPANTSLTFSSEGNRYEAPSGLGTTAAGWLSTSLTFGTRDYGILVAPAVVQDQAVNTALYASLLSAIDAQRQTRSAVYDVGCDELNGTGPISTKPLTASDVGAGTSIILPVRLIHFNAALINGSVLLSWKVADELHFSHYEIEWNNNGHDFKRTAVVQSKNSTGEITYTYPDLRPAIGKNYYRLKMVDKDGSYTYSSIKIVECKEGVALQFYPNPATTVLNITLGRNGRLDALSIVDVSGKLVRKLNTDNAMNTFTINLDGLINGTYLLQVIESSGVVNQYKFLVNK